MDDIETTRLILRRFEPEALQAGLSGDFSVVEECLGAKVPTDLAEDPAVLKHAQAALAADAGYLPWSARALILKSAMQMVGHVRFHSRPDPDYLRPYAPNAVEFGYVVFTAYRRRRYAQEALTGVMQWAQQMHGVDQFVASVSPVNLPSLNLISKFGFKKVGEAIDPVDGIEHIFLRDATRRIAAGPRRSS